MIILMHIDNNSIFFYFHTHKNKIRAAADSETSGYLASHGLPNYTCLFLCDFITFGGFLSTNIEGERGSSKELGTSSLFVHWCRLVSQQILATLKF